MEHAQPKVILTIAADVERIATALGCQTPTLPSDAVDLTLAKNWQAPAITPQTLCCLQYTSGTSGVPKGVMLNHAALLANCRQIQERFETNSQTRSVLWLPPYHDMGLVGGILHPLFVGFPVTLMPPAAFLQKPLRYLQAVSRMRATIAGGPCFSFGLCAPADQRRRRAAAGPVEPESRFHRRGNRSARRVGEVHQKIRRQWI